MNDRRTRVRKSESGVRLKRVYEPAIAGDGYRVLVDRLWPRGVSKQSLRIDAWLKEVAPSDELRHWFAHDPKRWSQFVRRYRYELHSGGADEMLDELARRAAQDVVTLVYAARDPAHNNAVVLQAEIERRRKIRQKAS